jgi:hypothetical protein
MNMSGSPIIPSAQLAAAGDAGDVSSPRAEAPPIGTSATGDGDGDITGTGQGARAMAQPQSHPVRPTLYRPKEPSHARLINWITFGVAAAVGLVSVASAATNWGPFADLQKFYLVALAVVFGVHRLAGQFP